MMCMPSRLQTEHIPVRLRWVPVLPLVMVDMLVALKDDSGGDATVLLITTTCYVLMYILRSIDFCTERRERLLTLMTSLPSCSVM